MELYVLDDLIRRIEVIDAFESSIWAERYNDIGDFRLDILSTSETRRLLTPGTLLTKNRSNRVMIVETVTKKVDAEGRNVLQIEGPSLESILKSRVAKNTMDDLTDDPVWEITDTPANICRKVFKEICIDGALSSDDIIPHIQNGDLTITPGSWAAMDPDLVWDDALGVWDDAYAGVVAEGDGDPSDIITVSLKPQSVYQVIKDLCDVYGMGFRLIRSDEFSELYFEVYTGFDRTTLQDDLPPIQFSTDLDNLSDSTELEQITDSANVAYVFAKNGFAVVYGNGADVGISGFDRRVITVDASDVDLAAGVELDAILQQKGLLALAQAKPTFAFDGDISKLGNYKYQQDYDLGDLLSLQKSDGTISKMRVTEQIETHDMEGEKSYPTLEQFMVVDPTQWAGQPANLEWDDVDPGLEWAEA